MFAMAAVRVLLLSLVFRACATTPDDDACDGCRVSLLQASLETNFVDDTRANATQENGTHAADVLLEEPVVEAATTPDVAAETPSKVLLEEDRPVTAASTNDAATPAPAPVKKAPAPAPVSSPSEGATSSSGSSIEPFAGAVWTAIALALLGCAVLVAKHHRGMHEEHPTLHAKLLAEFIGTFMLVFSVGCNVLIGDPTWAVVGIACTLMVLIYALGGISGANFNPAVSLALGLSGKLLWPLVLAYTLTQLAAAILAGIAYGVTLGKTFSLAPTSGFSGMQAGIAELLYTFMLCFCVLNTACSKKHAGKDQFYGLAIGFCVVAGGYGGGAISGGCFNPAVALGIDSSSRGFGNFFLYWVFQSLGAMFASAFFHVCRPDEHTNETMTDYPTHSKLVAEFTGTFMLVVTVGLNVLAPNGPDKNPGSKAAVFSIASSLMCMIFALGSCSGAHFNPAVTLAICARDKAFSKGLAMAYVIVQFIAGIAAAVTFILLQNWQTVPLRPKNGAFMGEFVFTFLLAYVVLCVATVRSPLNQYFGLAIGSCVTAGGLAIGSLSGGCLNPAVSAALGFTSGSILQVFVYSFVQLLAGFFAAFVFRHTHEVEFTEAGMLHGDGKSHSHHNPVTYFQEQWAHFTHPSH